MVTVDQVFLIHCVSSIWMTSLIWVIQLVHYPFFKFVDHRQQQKSASFHTQSISYCVLPAMLIEVSSWGFYLIVTKNLSLISIIITLLLMIIWGSTFFIQVPHHQSMRLGFNDELVNKLVTMNWIRTIAWSIKSCLLLLI